MIDDSPETILFISTDIFNKNKLRPNQSSSITTVYNSSNLTELLTNSTSRTNPARNTVCITVSEINTFYNISSMFRDLISVFSSLNITHINLSVDELTETIANHLAMIQTLTQLILNYHSATLAALTTLTQLNTLNTLKLYGIDRGSQSIYTSSTPIAFDISSWNENLKTFGLSLDKLSKETLLAIISKPIKHLHLLVNKPIDNSLWTECIDAITKNFHIRKITIGLGRGVDFSSKNAIYLKPLFSSRNIRHLELNGFSSEILSKENLPSLELNDNLESLSIHFRNISAQNELSNLLETLAKSNSIRCLALPDVLANELLLIAKLSKLESLEIARISFESNREEGLKNLINVISQHPTLQKFSCPFTVYLFNNSYRHDPTSNEIISNKNLLLNQMKRTKELQDNLNNCLTILRGFFNPTSPLSKLNLDVLKLILLEYINDLVWKTNEQKEKFIECMIEGFSIQLKESYVQKLKAQHIVIQEKFNFTESQFTFLLKDNVLNNSQKRSREHEHLESDKSQRLEESLTL